MTSTVFAALSLAAVLSLSAVGLAEDSLR